MKNKKGFIFVETILVTAILLASLMLVYSLFVASNNTETRRLRYDDPVKLYQTFYIKKYLESFELDTIKKKINSDTPVQMLYRSQNDLFGAAFNGEKNFFENLWANLHIQMIMLLPYDVSDISECNIAGKSTTYRNNVSGLCSNTNLVAYLKTLDNETSVGYRLVIEYQTNLAGGTCSSTNNCFSFYANVRVGA